MRCLKHPAQVGELVLVFAVCCIVAVLPRRLVVAGSRAVARLMCRFSSRFCKTAFANLDAVFGESLDAEEKADIVRRNFATIALSVLDVFWFAFFTEKRMKRYVKYDSSFDNCRNHAPLIVVTGHFGSWEALGLAIALQTGPLASVALPLANPAIDRWLNRIRRRTGQILVPRTGAVRTLLKTLKNGGRVGLLLDQNTLPAEGGVFVRFFGLPVPVSRAAEILAVRTGAPVVVTLCVPDDRGVYTVFSREPIRSNTPESRQPGSITQAFTRQIEEEIRRNPSKWFWIYKRWKYIPDFAGGMRFPDYARPVKET